MRIPKRAAAAFAATATALVLTACSSSGSSGTSGSAGSGTSTSPGSAAGSSAPSAASSSSSSSAPTAGAVTSWDRNPDQTSTSKKAGLQMLGTEMLQVHYHAHLDVIVDGKAVTVPAYIGIDENLQTITALHTHDTSGILHIESGQDIPFKLGQVFTEWGVPLTSTQVGPVTLGTDKVVKVIVNGKEVSGDPAQYVLKAHDEVVVWVGAKDATPDVPATYAFPQGV